jgi:hypothetical protein
VLDAGEVAGRPLNYCPTSGPLPIGTHLRLVQYRWWMMGIQVTYFTGNPQWRRRYLWPLAPRLVHSPRELFPARELLVSEDYAGEQPLSQSLGPSNWVLWTREFQPFWGSLQLLFGSPHRGRWLPLDPYGQQFRGLDRHSRWGYLRMPEPSAEQKRLWLAQKGARVMDPRETPWGGESQVK